MAATSSGKISLALGNSKKPAPTNGVKRSHATLHDHEEEDHGHGKAQTVSHFDKAAGGAIDERKPKIEKGPMIIAPQSNRDWKEASQKNKRQRSARVPEENGHDDDIQEHGQSKPTYGLNIRSKEEAVENGHATPEEANANANETTIPDANGESSIHKETDDQQAIDALLGGNEKASLILPAMTEEQAFERDYKEAPDMASLDDYARVPVEEFGAALLRGMGWKDGEGIGSNRGKKMEKTRLPERRPALLGIGAKEEAAVAQELGTWGKAAKDRKGPAVVYNPVLLRDKKTGELFTEEELEKKKKREEREKYEIEFEQEERQKEKSRRREERDDSRDRRPGRDDKESRGERKDRDRDRDRDRRKEDDSEDEYYRRKEKERRRRDRERNSSNYDSERSQRHDSDRDRHRDRQRDRRR